MTTDSNDLGQQLMIAAESEDIVLAASLIRAGNFIVFQQIDPDNGVSQDDEDASVVLAEVDDGLAVVCFCEEEAANDFAANIVQDQAPDVEELPAFTVTGESLLDSLPPEFGILVNAGAETECYFPPGAVS